MSHVHMHVHVHVHVVLAHCIARLRRPHRLRAVMREALQRHTLEQRGRVQQLPAAQVDARVATAEHRVSVVRLRACGVWLQAVAGFRL